MVCYRYVRPYIYKEGSLESIVWSGLVSVEQNKHKWLGEIVVRGGRKVCRRSVWMTVGDEWGMGDGRVADV